MSEEESGKPAAPDLPKYLREPLERQSPERLETLAAYASELAAWKRRQRQEELDRRRAEQAVDDDELEALAERDISTDPADYEDVPASGAYITVKTTKETDERSYRYYYWQWREGDAWKNEYIAPVTSGEDG
jgi:hypothetical protein